MFLDESVVGGRYSGKADFDSIALKSLGRANDGFVGKIDSMGHFAWAISVGGPGGDATTAVAASPTGELCVVGFFDSAAAAARFGDIPLPPHGGVDVFVAKLNRDGVIEWVRTAGGVGRDEPHAVAADRTGACYVVGEFEGPASFGTATLDSTGSGDVFVAKYDAQGSLVWARGAGGLAGEEGLAIALDYDANAYVTGRFSKIAVFGDKQLTATTEFDHQIDTDLFVTKLSASGNFVWAVSAGGYGDDVGRGIAADRSGQCFVSGSLRSTTSAFGATTVGSPGIFVAALNETGVFRWVTTVATSDGSDARGIAVDNNGNLYWSGSFSGAIRMGNATINSAGQSDVFFAILDRDGTVKGVQSAGGSGRDTAYSIAIDGRDRARIAGAFEDVFRAGDTLLTSVGGLDCFIWHPGSF